MKRYALLIGSNSGKGAETLDYAESDVDRVRDLLLAQTGWIKERIVTVCPASHGQQVVDAMRQLERQMSGQDFVLIYYSGHARMHASRGHPESLELMLGGSILHAEDLLKFGILGGTHRAALLVLDCCYAGLVAESAVQKFLREVSRQGDPDHSTAFSGKDRAVLVACGAKQAAYEGLNRDGVEGGFLTSSFIKGCEGGGPQLSAVDGDGAVTLATLISFIRKDLKREPTSRQQIFTDATFSSRDMYVRTSAQWRKAKRAGEYTRPEIVIFPEERVLELRPLWKSPQMKDEELVSAFTHSNPLTVALGYQRSNAVIFRQGKGWQTLAHVAQARGLKISPDGAYLLLGEMAVPGGPPALWVYDLNSNKPLYAIPTAAEHYCVTPENYVVAYNPVDKLLQVYAIDEQHHTLSLSSTPLPPVSHLRHVSGSSSMVLTGDEDGQVLAWDLSAVTKHKAKSPPWSGRQLNTAPDDTSGQVLRVAASSNGELAAAGFGDGAVRLWQIEDSSPLELRQYPHHKQLVTALEFSPDGEWLASGGGDGLVLLTNLIGDSEPTRLTFPGQEISSLSFCQMNTDCLLCIGTSTGRVFLVEIGGSGPQEVRNPHGRQYTFRVSLFAAAAQQFALITADVMTCECWSLAWVEAETTS